MNIYFACSITGGRKFEPIYQAITQTLLEAGHQVPTAHLAGADVIDLEAVVEPQAVYTRDIDWIRNCDALVAEVSTPSHGVGYEVAYALSIGKPVLCCYQQGQKVSKMLTGNTHDMLRLATYMDAPKAVEVVQEFLRNLPNDL